MLVPSVFLLYGCICQLGIKENNDDDDDDANTVCNNLHSFMYTPIELQNQNPTSTIGLFS